MSIISVLLYIVFILAAIVLVVVVLLQEGRGGGFGEALGSHGRETFGVGSKGINTFTGWTAAVFLGCALTLHWVNRTHASGTVLPDQPAPASTPAGAPGSAPGTAIPVTPSAPPSGPIAPTPPGPTPPAQGGGQ